MALLEFMSGRVTAAVAYSALNLLPCVGVKLDLSFCIEEQNAKGNTQTKTGKWCNERSRENSAR